MNDEQTLQVLERTDSVTEPIADVALETTKLETAATAELVVAGIALETETFSDAEPAPEPTAIAIPELEFSVTAGALKSALRGVERALGKSLPILHMFHIEADIEQERLAITATNLEITLTRYVDAALTNAGAICLPHILLPLLTNVADDKTVQVTLDPKTVTASVKAVRVASTLNGLPVTDYPITSPYENDAQPIGVLSFTRDELDEIVKRVLPFTADDESRPVLTGIHVTAAMPKGKDECTSVKFSAADGFRLVELTQREVPIKLDAKPSKDTRHALDVIVPGRFFVEALRLADESEKQRKLEDAATETKLEQVGLYEVEFFAIPQPKSEKEGEEKVVLGSPAGFVSLMTANGEALCHLIDGTYPDANKIIRAEGKLQTIPLPVQNTLGALASASLFASDSMNQVRLTCHVPEQCIVVSAQSSEHGAFSEAVEVPFGAASASPADNFEIALNVRYLVEIIKAATHESAEPAKMQISDPSKPVFMNARNFRSVLMPMDLAKPAPASASKPDPEPEPEPSSEKKSDPDPAIQQDAAAEQVVEQTNGTLTVTCPCGEKLQILPGGADICPKCERIIDHLGNVLDGPSK